VSRQPRAGEPGKPVTIRAIDAERTMWERAAEAEGCATLSAWIVRALNERAARVVPGKARRKASDGRE